MIQIKRKRQSGQSTLEAMIVLPLILLIFGFFGFQIFEVIGRTMINQLLEKALICETSEQAQDCEPNFRKQIAKFSKQMNVLKYSHKIHKRSSGVENFIFDKTIADNILETHSVEVLIAFPLRRQLTIQKDLIWSNIGPAMKN